MTTTTRTTLLLAALVASGCSRSLVREAPILQNGDRVGNSEGTIAAAKARNERYQDSVRAASEMSMAQAAGECAPAVCAALARGELAIDMNEAQVIAATRSAQGAWNVRRSGTAVVMVPRAPEAAPRDRIAEVALVQLSGGRVRSYTYSEPTGMRAVTSAEDATAAGRSKAMSEVLVREGDEFAAAGRLDLALDRYDRAAVVRQSDPELDYKIAAVLDRQLRPLEALMRYKLFLQSLEIERIRATGDANAKLAEAIAIAQQRVIVIERERGSR